MFYFLSQKNIPVVFECHKITRLRKILLKISIKKNTSKIIFLNQNLKDITNINKKFDKRLLIQGAGFDSDYFYSTKNKISKQVIYAGTLSRLGKNRDLDFIFNAFCDELLADFKLKVFGGTENEVLELKEKYKELTNVSFSTHVKKVKLSKELAEAEIGILASSSDLYSKYYTDPLKFYEYVASGLKIVATDFPSHRVLDKNKNILFFTQNDEESFKSALLEASKQESFGNQQETESMTSRTENIINFIS